MWRRAEADEVDGAIFPWPWGGMGMGGGARRGDLACNVLRVLGDFGGFCWAGFSKSTKYHLSCLQYLRKSNDFVLSSAKTKERKRKKIILPWLL
jgi:hypothetical protein